jgi:hypothetical protein
METSWAERLQKIKTPDARHVADSMNRCSTQELRCAMMIGESAVETIAVLPAL